MAFKAMVITTKLPFKGNALPKEMGSGHLSIWACCCNLSSIAVNWRRWRMSPSVCLDWTFHWLWWGAFRIGGWVKWWSPKWSYLVCMFSIKCIFGKYEMWYLTLEMWFVTSNLWIWFFSTPAHVVEVNLTYLAFPVKVRITCPLIDKYMVSQISQGPKWSKIA